MATVAAHLGLSRATVTHVLNGRADEQRIRPETQRRVLEAAQEMGYRPNASARAVRAGRFGSVALIQSLLGAYLPGPLLYGVTQAIAEKDLHLVLTQVPDGVIGDESYLPHTMRELSVDGALINRHVGFPLPFLEQIHRLRIPAVSLNVQQESDCVHPDEVMGGRLATEFLLRLGHERVTYMETAVSEEPHFSKHDRREGYEQAMASAGRPPRVHQIPGDWHTPGHPEMDAQVWRRRGRCWPARTGRQRWSPMNWRKRWRWCMPRIILACVFPETSRSSSSITGSTTAFSCLSIRSTMRWRRWARAPWAC